MPPLLNNSIDKRQGEWECNGLCKSVTEDIAVIALPYPPLHPSLPPSVLILYILPSSLSDLFLPFVSRSNTPGPLRIVVLFFPSPPASVYALRSIVCAF